MRASGVTLGAGFFRLHHATLEVTLCGYMVYDCAHMHRRSA